MAKRRARSQTANLIPNQKKSRIDPIYLDEKGVRHTVKKLNESYNFVLNRISIRGFFAKLWGSKIVRVPTGAISGLSFGSPEREKPFGCGLCGQPQSIL
jgi:hypothetical protein